MMSKPEGREQTAPHQPRRAPWRQYHRELRAATRATPRRYVMLWRNKWLTAKAGSLEEMIDALRSAANHLAQMLAGGVTLDPGGGTEDDYAYLVTTNPDIARKYEMHDEREFPGDGEVNEQVDE